MAKLTLLTMVQKVLNSLSSDDVSTISETVESSQIIEIIEDVFYNLVTNKIIPEHELLARLEGLSDLEKPNYLKLTDATVRIQGIRYNTSTTPSTTTTYKNLVYLKPSEFLQRMDAMDSSTAVVDTITDFGNTRILCYNDRFPSFWTSFDDEYVITDAYHSDYDDTLQPSKSQVIVHKVPTFSKTDSYIPDIDDNLFPLLLNEAKSWAHLELRQNVHQKAEKDARSQRVGYQRLRSRVTEDDTRRDFGR